MASDGGVPRRIVERRADLAPQVGEKWGHRSRRRRVDHGLTSLPALYTGHSPPIVRFSGVRTLRVVMADSRWSPPPQPPPCWSWRDVVPIALCALTMLLTVLAISTGARASPHQFWLAFVPVGAIACGACAVSGGFVGAVLCGRRPAARVTIAMRAASVLVYVMSCAAPARTVVVEVLSLDPSGFHQARVTGLLAQALVILAGVGFVVGAAAVTHRLAAPVHCARCRRYLPLGAGRLPAVSDCDFAPTVSRNPRTPVVPLLVRRRPQIPHQLHAVERP
jgi:hypothetical protein